MISNVHTQMFQEINQYSISLDAETKRYTRIMWNSFSAWIWGYCMVSGNTVCKMGINSKYCAHTLTHRQTGMHARTQTEDSTSWTSTYLLTSDSKWFTVMDGTFSRHQFNISRLPIRTFLWKGASSVKQQQSLTTLVIILPDICIL